MGASAAKLPELNIYLYLYLYPLSSTDTYCLYLLLTCAAISPATLRKSHALILTIVIAKYVCIGHTQYHTYKNTIMYREIQSTNTGRMQPTWDHTVHARETEPLLLWSLLLTAAMQRESSSSVRVHLLITDCCPSCLAFPCIH